MGVLRTDEDTFDGVANANSYMTDQHYEFSVPERGSNSYFQILPKNFAISQSDESEIVHTLNHDDDHDGILQVFQATFDNVNYVKFLTKGSFPASEEITVLDDCDYSTNNAAQTSWVTNNTGKILVQSVDWEDYDGDYCVGFNVNSRAEGYYVTHTFASSQDWSTISAFDFMWNTADENSRWQLILKDNIGQIATVDFSSNDDGQWENKHFTKDIFHNKDVVDWGKIVSISFKNLNSCWTHWTYLDRVQIFKNIDNTHISSEVSLVHLGTNPSYDSIGDILTLDNDHDSKAFMIQNDTKRITPCKLLYGAKRNDWKLVLGDYYGLFIRKPDKGAISFYGSNTQKFESDLYHVNNADDITPMNKSLAFMMCTFSESTIKKLIIKQNIHSPKSNINLMIMNPETEQIKKFLGIYTFDTSNTIEIDYDYSAPETITIDLENHFYIYYQDSQDSQTSKLYVNPRFHYDQIGE